MTIKMKRLSKLGIKMMKKSSKKKKKELKPAINIKTLGNTVYLDFNGKTILKAGTIVVNYNTETPDVSLFDWHIGYKKEKKWWMIFRKRTCGVQIEGDSVIISGESKDNIVLASEEDNELVDTSKQLYFNRQQQDAENIINQLRGYFQAEEDERVKDSSMRMLDELEMILKS